MEDLGNLIASHKFYLCDSREFFKRDQLDIIKWQEKNFVETALLSKMLKIGEMIATVVKLSSRDDRYPVADSQTQILRLRLAV